MISNLKVITAIIILFLVNCGISSEKIESTLYLYADELPKFGQSDKELNQYIYKNLVWPKLFDGSGQVLVSFVITKSGKIVNIQIEKSLCEECDNEVLRLLSNMPTWIPGKKDGELINVKIYLPVYFTVK